MPVLLLLFLLRLWLSDISNKALIEWFTKTQSSSGRADILVPKAFSNTYYAVFRTYATYLGSGAGNASASNLCIGKTTTEVSIYFGSSSINTVMFGAIGY